MEKVSFEERTRRRIRFVLNKSVSTKPSLGTPGAPFGIGLGDTADGIGTDVNDHRLIEAIHQEDGRST